MNSVIQLLAELADKDIRLWVEDGKLRFSAPEGAMTPAIKGSIVAQKTPIIEFLEQARKPQQIAIPRCDRNARLAASFAQQRLWFLNQLDPDSPAYNMAGALRLKGTLDLNALNRALSEIVSRHEILRTRYADDIHGLTLIIEQPSPITLAAHALPAALNGKTEDIISTLAQQEAVKPFNLVRDDVMRATLYRIADDDHVLLTTLHHIASDGWSMGVLIAELAALYTAFRNNEEHNNEAHNGQAPPLPELALQYTDYAAWQRDWLSGERLEKQLQFWRTTLADAQVLQLPIDKPRPPMATSHGDSVLFDITPATTAALNALARAQGATLFMVLMSAFRLLLGRYSRQSDITIGTPVAGRALGQLESLIGCFINTVAIRSDSMGCNSFNDALAREKNAAQAAFDHQDVPFEQVVDALNLARDMAYTPVFQVMFALQNAPANYDTRLPGLAISAIDLDKRAAMFDLKLSMNEFEGRIVSEFEYRTDLFERATIERLARHFSSWLGAIVAAPSASLATLNFIGTDEQQFLLGTCNIDVTTRHAPELVHRRFETIADKFGSRIAVSCDTERATYTALNARANQIAHALIARDVRVGDFVGLALERCCDLPAGILGIAKAGAAYVPLDPHFPADRLAYIYEDAQAKALVSTQTIIEQLKLPRDHAILLDRDAAHLQSLPQHNPNLAQDAASVLYVLYTSGTTGKPKGCLVTHANVARLMRATESDFGFDENDRWTLFHSYAFDFTVWEMWGAFFYGGELVVVPYYTARDSEAFYALLRDQRITVLNQTPSAFSQLIAVDAMQSASSAPLSLRYVVFGGEALDFPALRTWAQRHGLAQPKLVNMYGITETTVHVTRYTVTQGDLEKPRSIIGRPITDLHLHIVSPELALLPVGVPGEIVVSGAGVTNGYLHRADLTAEKFVSNPFQSLLPAALRDNHQRLYRSGDLARRLPNGDVEYLGRIDQQVKIRGHRIELGEIEAALGQQPGIREAVVLARQLSPATGGKGDVRLAGYLLLAAGEQIDLAVLRENLKAFLPEYMIPSAFVTLTEWPLTPTGKVDKKALPEPDVTMQARAFVAPRNELEQQIATVFADVLGVERVGINDSFFELGGHSLLATQVVSRLRNLTTRELPLRAMFVDPTVAGIAQALQTQAADSAPPLTAITPRPAQIPLSFAQQRLWLVDQLMPGNSAYHMPAALKLAGKLDTAALQQAIADVITRHEVLRTTFVTDADGKPWQHISADHGFTLVQIDLRELTTAAREAAITTHIGEIAWQAFDLSQGPLLRVRLLQTGSDEYLLLLCMHHSISDGWSIGVLTQEIGALYLARAADQLPAPAPLPLQYADFSLWQRNWLQGDVLAAQLAFWKSTLADVPVLELPVDAARDEAGNASAEISAAIDTDTAERLQQLATKHGVTLFMLLDAVFAILLSRHSGQQDFCIGTPIANRNRAEIEPLIGFFVNTLALRHDLSGNPRFGELLARVKAATLSAYDHQDLPFEQVVEEIGVPRRLDVTPLFQVMFVLNNTPQQLAFDLPGLDISEMALGSHPAKFDLTLTVGPAAQGLTVNLRYRTPLFSSANAQRLLTHWRTLLDAVLRDDAQPLQSLPMLSAAEIAELDAAACPRTIDWNAPSTLWPLFEHAVSARAEQPAVVYQQQTLTFAQLQARANAIAAALQNAGAQRGDNIGLLLDRSTDLPAAILGCWALGCAYVPLDATYPQERLQYIVGDAGVKLALCDAASRNNVTLSNCEPVALDQIATNTGIAFSGPQPEDIAYIIYTSGTTGQPKGVEITHANLVNLGYSLQQDILGSLANERCRVGVNASFAFDGSVKQLLQICFGHTLLPIPQLLRLDARGLQAYIAEHGINVLDTTPSQLVAFLPHWDEAARALLPKRILIGGEAITPALWRELGELAQYGVQAFNVYGPTECTVDTSWTPIAAGSKPGIGAPLPNVQVYIVDDAGNRVPRGVTGELWVGGPGVARGYRNAPALTAEKFVSAPFAAQRVYRTGDQVRLNADGTLDYRGRRDNQIKIRGFRIETGDIEAAISAQPNIDAVAVSAQKRGEQLQLAAYVVANDSTLDKNALRQRLKSQLPDYMVPACFVQIAQLPLTANGKVDYRALPAPADEDWRTQQFVAPGTETEQTLAEVWQRVIGIERIGIHDNFFELGGHSLMATQILAQLKQHYRVEIELRKVFEEPTIAAIAALIDSRLAENAMLISDDADVADDDEEFVL